MIMRNFYKMIQKKAFTLVLAFICVLSLKAQVQITIDGVANEPEWANAPAMSIAKTIALESKTGITDDSDLSGVFKVLWDANNIYYYLEVKDENLHTNETTGYLNDNFGIYFDLKNLKTDFYGSDNSDSTIFNWEYQWQNNVWGGRTATTGGGEWGGKWSNLYTPTSTQYVATVTPGVGYSIEWVLPVTEEAGITLSVGSVIGFDTKIADNDGTGRDQMGWNMSEDIAWHKPTFFGSLKLLADGTVEKVSILPTIDGVADYAWNQTAFMPIAKTIAAESKGGIKSDNDLSGKFKVLWDANNIYYYLEVKDDTLHTNETTGYLNDNFGIYLDLKNLKTDFYGSDNSDSTIFNWEYQWQNDAWGGRTATTGGGEWGGKWSALYTPANGIEYVATVTPGVGYTIEWVLPVTEKAGITLEAGNTIGFDTKIADNDGSGRDQKGWNMSEDMAWHKPTFFGSLKLLVDNTVEKISILPTIDGVADYAWNQATFIPIAKTIAAESTTGIKSENDLSGKFKLLWDADNIYYYLEVKDDTLHTNETTSYLNDNFGIYFDLKNLKTEFYGSDNSDSTIFNWEYQWQNDVWGGRTATTGGGEWGGKWSALYTPENGTQYVATVTPGVGYTIEWVLPIAEKAGISIAAGNTIGFDTKIADNDGTGRDQKGWFMSSDNAWHQPKLFGTITAEKGGTFQISKPLSNVADLASLTLSAGTLDKPFDSKNLAYSVELPAGTTAVPTITAVAKESKAKVAIAELAELPGKVKITVTAEDGITKKEYVIDFTIKTGISNNMAASFNVYPNPVENILNIQGAEKINSIAVYNATGQLQKTVVVDANSAQINLNGLNKGIYYISLKSENNVAVKKVLKR
jgi:hypothetical protein